MLARERERHERGLEGVRRLEQRLTFRLAILQRLLDRQITRLLSRHDMSLGAYRVLVTIQAFGEIAAADLVRMIALDKAMVSRSCADLARAEMIAIRPDPHSARRKLLSLTEAGAAALAAVEPDVADRNDALDALFSAEERRALDTALDRLTRRTAEALEAPAAARARS